jgi:hypothetical protein
MAVIRNRGANARNVSQKIWLSSAEAQAVKDRAAAVPVAAWLRDLALGQRPQPRLKPRHRITQDAKVVAALTLAIAKVGNNLNQVARRVNSQARQHRTVDLVQLRYQLAAIKREMLDARESVCPRE